MRTAFELITAADSTDPIVTTAEIKEQLRIDHVDQDVFIDSLAKAAEEWVESALKRQLRTATWDLHLDCFPGLIEIRKCPVASITSVTYTDTDGDSQTLAASNYSADLKGEPARIEEAYNTTWPSTREIFNAVTIRFVAGYGAASAVPERAKTAVKMLVDHWYWNPANIGQATPELNKTVMALLSSLKWTNYA